MTEHRFALPAPRAFRWSAWVVWTQCRPAWGAGRALSTGLKAVPHVTSGRQGLPLACAVRASKCSAGGWTRQHRRLPRVIFHAHSQESCAESLAQRGEDPLPTTFAARDSLIDRSYRRVLRGSGRTALQVGEAQQIMRMVPAQDAALRQARRGRPSPAPILARPNLHNTLRGLAWGAAPLGRCWGRVEPPILWWCCTSPVPRAPAAGAH